MIKKTLTILVLLFILSYATVALAQSPGSVSDPLVSKSYVDQFLTFRSVELKSGTFMKPNAGGFLILFSGQIRYVSKTGKELSDLTSGRAAKAGTYLAFNRLYVISQDADFELQVKKDSTALVFGISDSKINIKQTSK